MIADHYTIQKVVKAKLLFSILYSMGTQSHVPKLKDQYWYLPSLIKVISY